MELARQSILIRELLTDFQKKHPVTDAEIQAEYDKVKAQVKARAAATRYRVSHILVDNEDEAKALIVQIKGGASFEDLAKNSKDPGVRRRAGDLDWAEASAYVPEFSQAMVKLKKGEMTEVPVKSQFGWHVIKVVDVREGQFPPLGRGQAADPAAARADPRRPVPATRSRPSPRPTTSSATAAGAPIRAR